MSVFFMSVFHPPTRVTDILFLHCVIVLSNSSAIFVPPAKLSLHPLCSLSLLHTHKQVRCCCAIFYSTKSDFSINSIMSGLSFSRDSKSNVYYSRDKENATLIPDRMTGSIISDYSQVISTNQSTK